MDWIQTIPNEVWWLIMLAADFGTALILFKLFRKQGLYAFIVMNILICNLQVIKIIPLFGFTTTLGNIAYGSIYFATDLLSEVYGKRAARRGVWFGFCALIYMTITLQLALRFTPVDFEISQTISSSMDTLFGFLPFVALGSITAYLLSQLHDIWAFGILKEKTKGKHLWLRNNVSTTISQLIDTTIFTAIAFGWWLPFNEVFSIFWTTLVIKIVVALLDTPFLYWSRALARKWGEGEYVLTSS